MPITPEPASRTDLPPSTDGAEPDGTASAAPTPGGGHVLTGPVVEQSATLPIDQRTTWQLLTTPIGISAWYTVGGGAEIEPTEGSLIKLWWEPDTKFHGRILRAAAPQRLDYRLAQGVNVDPEGCDSTLVQFKVEPADDPAHTTLTVRESGFTEITNGRDAYAASSMAWIGALGMLQQLTSQAAAEPAAPEATPAPPPAEA
ncbi:SRPBCC family protein [Propionibacteriaceae bacterium Y2011]|uniref:SRPBCC family protein n=1 Tax=Microlunatus sp. Y2014 TaxID=3418488 RepID=UPI003B4D8A67